MKEQILEEMHLNETCFSNNFMTNVSSAKICFLLGSGI